MRTLLFNSFSFIFILFPITFLVYWLVLRTKSQKYIWLTVMSYIFYGIWNFELSGLMLISTLIDYFSGMLISKNPNSKFKRKLGLMMSIIGNLGLLGFFKYYNFGMNSANSILSFFGITANLPLMNIILPVGISFYTFQTMSYTIEVYLGKEKATKSFWEFACYVSLFPQLVAGPIVRYSDIVKDLDNINNLKKTESFHLGLNFFIVGLAKKLIIADTIASLINPMLANYSNLGFFLTWFAILGYTYQLYFDFSGYSDMAIGLGLLLGFKFPQNFNSPYKAKNISDFWRRWHITLSSWLRDYLYIAWLGGNRKGKYWTYFNLIVTMLLGGLWHGANWTFVIWGLYHGILLALYKMFGKQWDSMNIFLQRSFTFVLVVIGWVFFRSTDFTMAISILGTMFNIFAIQIPMFSMKMLLLMGILLFCLIITNFMPNSNEMKYPNKTIYAIIIAILFVICLLIIGKGESPFLYYQF